jgi:peroxiredoxin
VNPGQTFPDLDLPDHTGRARRLSELAGGDPVALFASRGWWCPKEQRYLTGLTRLQDEFEVAYARIVVLSVDPPEVQSAFRAGLGARFTFLSDAERRWLPRLDLLETTERRAGGSGWTRAACTGSRSAARSPTCARS